MAANPPSYDVFLVDDIWYAEFAKNGWALDVTDRITSDMKSKIFDSAWPITTVAGTGTTGSFGFWGVQAQSAGRSAVAPIINRLKELIGITGERTGSRCSRGCRARCWS